MKRRLLRETPFFRSDICIRDTSLLLFFIFFILFAQKQSEGTRSAVYGDSRRCLTEVYFVEGHSLIDLFSDPDKIVIHLECNDTYTFWDDFKNEVEKISGKEVTDKLVKSSVDYKHRFLAGCAIAERVLFFNRGGFKPNI